MMMPLLFVAALASAEPLKVLVLDLRTDASAAEVTRARVVHDEVAVELGRDARLEVLSSDDVRSIVSIDAERRELGCNEDASCLVEVGAALGARYIVHGAVTTLGGTVVVHLNLFDTELGKALARETAEATSDAQLLPAVRAAISRIRARMLGEGTGATDDTGVLVAGGVLAAIGGVTAATGAVLAGLAWPTFADGTGEARGGPSGAERQDAQGVGQLGMVLGGAGVAVLLGGAAVTTWAVLE